MTDYNLHPWNETFEWSDAVTRTGYLTEDQVNKYNNDGFVVLEKALDVTKLQEIIDQEDKQKPFSDDELVRQLGREGLKVARRTVTKYRKSMGIPSSRQRREWRSAGE